MRHFHISFLLNIPQNTSFKQVKIFWTWFVFRRVPADQKYCMKENSLKNLEEIVTVVYLDFVLLRIYEWDILIQMAVEYVPAQKFKESTKWTAQIANINEYISVNAGEPGNSSGRML